MQDKKNPMDIGFMAKLVSIKIEKQMNYLLQEVELTSSQCNMLGYLTDHKGEEVHPMDFEKKFNLTKPTVCGLLQRLEQKEFISVEESQKDKRFKTVHLTDKAVEHKKVMDEHIQAVTEIALKDIPKEDIQIAESVLVKMLENLSKEESCKEESSC